MKKENIEIAKRCKKALDKADIMLKDLANQVGKSGATITDYLNGSIRIPATIIAVIAKETGETLDWLITGNERVQLDHQAHELETDEDTTILWRAVIEAVEEHLQGNNQQLAPAKKAELITTLYEMFAEEEKKQVDKKTVTKLIRLAS